MNFLFHWPVNKLQYHHKFLLNANLWYKFYATLSYWNGSLYVSFHKYGTDGKYKIDQIINASSIIVIKVSAIFENMKHKKKKKKLIFKKKKKKKMLTF